MRKRERESYAIVIVCASGPVYVYERVYDDEKIHVYFLRIKILCTYYTPIRVLLPSYPFYLSFFFSLVTHTYMYTI